jgi:hypothetical protein
MTGICVLLYGTIAGLLLVSLNLYGIGWFLTEGVCDNGKPAIVLGSTLYSLISDSVWLYILPAVTIPVLWGGGIALLAGLNRGRLISFLGVLLYLVLAALSLLEVLVLAALHCPPYGWELIIGGDLITAVGGALLLRHLRRKQIGE